MKHEKNSAGFKFCIFCILQYAKLHIAIWKTCILQYCNMKNMQNMSNNMLQYRKQYEKYAYFAYCDLENMQNMSK